MITRRDFLAGCGTTLLMGGPLLGVGRTWAATDFTDSFTAGPDKATWKALLNQDFWLYQSAGKGVRLTLVEITEKPDDPDAATKLDQFTLTFAGKKTEPVLEGTYDLMHVTQGNLVLHLQPVGKDARGAYYRSEFCLLT